jgi:hypothetical protein
VGISSPQVLMTERYLYNPELELSKLITMYGKLCLQSGCNVASIGSLALEKFDDRSLIILLPNVLLTDFKVQDEKIIFQKDTQSNMI